MEHANSKNIAEALELLEAAAREKKDEVRSVMSDKYATLRGLIVENDANLLTSLTAVKEHAIQAAIRAKEASVEKAREIAREVDKNVRQNPWAYIAGTAAVGLLLGYILGRNRK